MLYSYKLSNYLANILYPQILDLTFLDILIVCWVI